MKPIADRVGGIIGIMLGIAALWQSAQLYKYRIGLFVGDHLFPGIIGLGLCAAGILLAVRNPGVRKNEDPKNEGTLRILGVPVLLLGYAAILPIAGYVAATWIASVLLFKLVGTYRWPLCLLAASVLTAALDMVFIEWLNTPFPPGLFFN